MSVGAEAQRRRTVTSPARRFAPAGRFLKPYLEAGETALGTRVNVRHLAATPAGRRVTGEAEVTRIDGRKIEFSVSATDVAEQIGVGTHERMVIDSAKLAAGMKAKFASS